MPQIKNQSATDARIGKAVQPSDLPASMESETGSPKAAIAKPAAAQRSKGPDKPGKP